VAFEAFRSLHTGQNIADAIERCVEKYSLREKVTYIVTDNASNMRKAFSVMEEWSAEVNVDYGGLDAEDLWNDLDSADLDNVSLVIICGTLFVGISFVHICWYFFCSINCYTTPFSGLWNSVRTTPSQNSMVTFSILYSFSK